jgi:tRNA-specific 2-thiouridylase
MFAKGDFLDMKGRPIGHHDGAARFTIGQRRGIRFSSDRKLYVVATDIEKNTVTLGEDKDLFCKHVMAVQPVYWRKLRIGEMVQAKVRYLSRLHEAEITEAESGCIRARFVRPVRAVTPGQVCAFYQGDTIVAAGIIT